MMNFSRNVENLKKFAVDCRSVWMNFFFFFFVVDKNVVRYRNFKQYFEIKK